MKAQVWKLFGSPYFTGVARRHPEQGHCNLVRPCRPRRRSPDRGTGILQGPRPGGSSCCGYPASPPRSALTIMKEHDLFASSLCKIRTSSATARGSPRSSAAWAVAADRSAFVLRGASGPGGSTARRSLILACGPRIAAQPWICGSPQRPSRTGTSRLLSGSQASASYRTAAPPSRTRAPNLPDSKKCLNQDVVEGHSLKSTRCCPQCEAYLISVKRTV